MASVDLYEVEYPYTLESLIDALQANIRMLSWILGNLDSDNIKQLDTAVTKIVSESEQFEIDDNVLRVSDASGNAVCEISPDGALIKNCGAQGDWDFRYAQSIRGLKSDGDGAHNHGIPNGTVLLTQSGTVVWNSSSNSGTHSHEIKAGGT